MDPSTLGCLLLLRYGRDLWDASSIDKVITKKREDAEARQRIQNVELRRVNERSVVDEMGDSD